MNKSLKIILFITLIGTIGPHMMDTSAFAQTEQELNESFNDAKTHLQKGEYKQALKIYDQILIAQPHSIETQNMKGIALSSIDDHKNSLKQFFQVLQSNPKQSVALIGMGMGFGNLGEYKEALIYLEKAESEKPNSEVIKNYKKIIEDVIKKYPYTPTEKPINNNHNVASVPKWIKDTTNWWSLSKISDERYLNSVEYMIEREIIQIPKNKVFENKNELKMISWVRNNLSEWSQDSLSNEEFFKSANWLIENKFINTNLENSKKSLEELTYERYLFDKYLREISNNIIKEKRYIEDSNPSKGVIKKFLRDYVKWNFEQQVQKSATDFPNPTYEIVDEVYIINYKIYINNQPAGLPLDHISTLKNSFEFWESEELSTNNQKAKIKFEITKSKSDANVWVTWVIRNIGEGVLGHAHVGKGVVEVALGDYNCDGSFQLYNIQSVETIMTHELGHSIGLYHTNEKDNIMYPSMTPSYAYCLLQ
jgi:tetratricopeptide (TPR) repeat protein